MNSPFEKKICYTLCCTELTAVLSCVFMFYLTFGIYIPAYNQLNAGFSNETVMCTTVSNITLETCEDPIGVPSWASCGEWCLSKSSGGPCVQIRVNVRQNGTNIKLEGCDPTMEDVIYCDDIDPKEEPAECIRGQCADLTGLYNCTITSVSPGVQEAAVGARCRDISRVLTCNLTLTDPGIQCRTKKACLELDGLYLCVKGYCSRIQTPFHCEKRCTGIVTRDKSIIVRENNVIYTANCKRAIDMETGVEIWPKNLISGSSSGSDPDSPTIYLNSSDVTDKELTTEPPLMVIFCTTIVDRQTNSTTIRMLDCFNGTLLTPGYFGDLTEIKILTNEHTANTRWLDVTGQIAPDEADLIIQHNSPLYINYEACVNTLILEECKHFYAEYGVYGSDLRTNKRFQCYYRPEVAHLNDTIDQNFVIVRFDLKRTTMELMIAALVPAVLAIISCFLLVVFSKVIKIGNDQRFYIEMCGNIYKPDVEMDIKKK